MVKFELKEVVLFEAPGTYEDVRLYFVTTAYRRFLDKVREHLGNILNTQPQTGKRYQFCFEAERRA